MARRYIAAIRILYEAQSLDELREVRWMRFHALKGDKQGIYSITLQGGWRMEADLIPGGAVRILNVEMHYGD